jgi:hypothetical protein
MQQKRRELERLRVRIRIFRCVSKSSARREFISRLKRTWANEPSAGTLDIMSQRHGIEPAPVLQGGSVAGAKFSDPKPPEPKSGRKQVIKMIVQNNEIEHLL